MTYYPDLSPYEYFEYFKGSDMDALNVGWLDGSTQYPIGTAPEEFKERLAEFCSSENIVNLTRGFHACNLDNCPLSSPEFVDGQTTGLGNGEIRVIGKSAIYAAPTLIYHYIVAHDYKPPDEFIEALLTGTPPNSEEYQDLRRKMKEHEESYFASRREQTRNQPAKKPWQFWK